MRHTTILSLGIGLAITWSAIGCSAIDTENAFGNSGGSAGSAGEAGQAGSAGQGGTGGTGGSGGSGGDGGFILTGSGGGGGNPPLQPGEVYGHSPDTLYKLEPYSKQVSVIGPFQGCSSVIDIAIDKDSNIIGTTFGGIYWIDKTNAKCTLIATGSYPNSLSFVPAGTLDPTTEVLVGYNGSQYVRIDTTTGKTTIVGAIGNGYSSSGDIVSVQNGGTYLTVNGNGCGDCLLQVDPKTGAMVKNWGPVGYGAVYGIAYWAGSVYGFTNAGQLFEVKFVNGQLVSSGEIMIPNPPPNLQFWGAGSTTIAPIEPPPK